jgi:DNA-binding NtrC family response regulator
VILTEPGDTLEIRTNQSVHAISNTDDWLNENFSFPESGFDLEKEIIRLIQMAIAQTDGNISEASRLLGVPRDYIRYRLKKKS